MNAVLPFTITVTKDPALLREYFELRDQAYRLHNENLPAGFGGEEPVDHMSDIVVALDEGRVVGGARLTITRPETARTLPMEHDGFVLAEMVPDLDLRWRAHGEISRFAVDRRYAEGSQVARQISDKLCDVAAERATDIVFAICPRGQVRLNQRNARECGVEFRHYQRIRMRNEAGEEMTLCAYSGMMRRAGK
ncbi:MAG: hypothetical protein U0Q16_19725 [Bryobacteraceae bacterium]